MRTELGIVVASALALALAGCASAPTGSPPPATPSSAASTAPSTLTGSPVPTIGTSTTFECVEPPLPPQMTPQVHRLPMVVDRTGLIEACGQTDALIDLVGDIGVSNQSEDSIEVIWEQGGCDAFITFTFGQASNGFDLVGERPATCPSAGIPPLPLLIRFSRAVPADRVHASLVTR